MTVLNLLFAYVVTLVMTLIALHILKWMSFRGMPKQILVERILYQMPIAHIEFMVIETSQNGREKKYVRQTLAGAILLQEALIDAELERKASKTIDGGHSTNEVRSTIEALTLIEGWVCTKVLEGTNERY